MCYHHFMDRTDKKYKSHAHYILLALLPYTEANIKLSFKPSEFFDDLEKLDKLKTNKSSLKTTYYRLIKRGLVKLDDSGTPRLTRKGINQVKPYKAKKLQGSSLMVIFDIPEQQRHKRRRFRTLLKELYFNQIQRGVWESRYDHRDYLRTEIDDMQLQEYVKVYESSQIEI